MANLQNSKFNFPIALEPILLRQTDPTHLHELELAQNLATRLKDATGRAAKWASVEVITVNDLDLKERRVRESSDEQKSLETQYKALRGDEYPEAVHTVPLTNVIQPIQRSAAQDAAILEKIALLGLNPQSLPRSPIGKSGVKAEVRSALKGNKLFAGTTVFDKAWERLAAHGDISISP